LEAVQGILAGIPHTLVLAHENYYSSIIYTILKMVGLPSGFEVLTNRGRLDCALEFKERVYIFEFKLRQTPEKALEQIREKGYAEKYRGCGKPIHLVGVRFDAEKRNITAWREERPTGG
ncbi:MAG: hypothetical protein D6679_02025, partial [Candidatus Hydrogenedentota bacterium]